MLITTSTIAYWNLVPTGGVITLAYSDLVSILLTGIGVILAALALFIAILAIWGYSQFQSMTRTASANHLEKLLKDGPFRKEVEAIIVNHVSAELRMREGPLRTILEERVDAQLNLNAQERAEEEEE